LISQTHLLSVPQKTTQSLKVNLTFTHKLCHPLLDAK